MNFDGLFEHKIIFEDVNEKLFIQNKCFKSSEV